MVYHFILWTLFAEIIPKKHSFFKIRILLEPMFAFKRMGIHGDLFCCGSISKIWTNMDKHILKLQCPEALEQSSISFGWSVLVWRVNVKFLGWNFVGEVNTSPKHKTPDGRPKFSCKKQKQIYIYIHVHVENSADLLKESRCPLEGNDAGSKYIVIALWLCRESLMISVEQRQTETEPLCAAQMSGVQRFLRGCWNKTVRKNGWPKFWKTHSKWIISDSFNAFFLVPDDGARDKANPIRHNIAICAVCASTWAIICCQYTTKTTKIIHLRQ